MDILTFLLMAPPPGEGGGGMGSTLIMLGAMGLIFYFMLIRPQSKRMKAHKELVGSVKRGDRVVMNGGIHGKVHEVKESTVLVEIARNTVVEYDKGAIQNLMRDEDELVTT